MAIYHFQAKVIGRAQGRSVVAAAAYRAGEVLRDEELGVTHNYSGKPVLKGEILLPPGAPERWRDRATLWNEVDAGEVRRDAVLAREIEVALPRELSQAEAIQLVRDFVHEQFVDRGMVADFNVHWGTASDGHAQPHAHVLLTMRRLDPDPDVPGVSRFGLKERGWNDKVLLRGWRERWAEMANARLAELGHDVRIDHRSNAARGIELAPQNKIGPAGARRATRGEDAERADEHRAIARRNGERLLAEPGLVLQMLTQQQSTFTRQDLARLVNRHTDGAGQFAAVMARVEASPELVRVGEDGRGQARFSTSEMVEVERRMEAAAVGLDRQARHAVPLALRQAPPPTEKGIQLDAEQLLAFQHVTRARDLAVVAGVAGSGKSTMLGVARQVWAVAGYRVRGAALSGIAAEGLEAGSGIESRTVASLEHAWARGRETLEARDVLVVDEAGMIGSRQMERVLAAAAEAGAKVVLVGDAEQLQAIEAGAAFRAIAERVGVAEITEVRRQRTPWQREATRELATRPHRGGARTATGRRAAVHGHATLDRPRTQLVAWPRRTMRPGRRISQIILAHRRVDVADLNRRVRAGRQDAGMLGPEQVLPTEPWASGRLAEGDRVYFLRNERGLGVKNGTLGTVRRIDGTGEAARLTVRLDGPEGIGRGRTVEFDLAEYADLDHGYAATVHKAQGVTVDRAHVLATEGMDRHLAYVALSRHRDAVSLHWSTDSFADAAALARQLGRERAKDTTLDYAAGDGEVVRAYAERRGLDPLQPDSAIVVRPSSIIADQPAAVATAAEPAASLTPAAASPVVQSHGMFAGLRLNAAPLPKASVPAPSPVPDAAPRAHALMKYLEALNVLAKMHGQALPVLPHQEAAAQDAADRLDALRPGFIKDLAEVNQRQPELLRHALAGSAGWSPLVVAVQRRPADRKAEQDAEAERKAKADAQRAEFEALAPARERVLQERMAQWWQTHHPYARLSDYGYPALQAEAKSVETVLRAEIARMPAAELRPTAAKLARADKLAA